jgi:hypothetical protein
MCQPVRQDDPSIAHQDRLFRRVHLVQVVRDDDTGLARISSSAFRDKELSINIESVLLSGGQTAVACLEKYPNHKLAAITAGEARQYQQAVCRDPLPEVPSHGLICGSKSPRHIQDGLRTAAQWIAPAQAPLYADILREKRSLGLPE